MTLSGTAGLSFSFGDGTADAFMVFQGSMADINASLDGMVFTPPPGYGGPAGLTITTDDLGNTGEGGAKLDTDNLSILVGDVNDAPFNTVPGAQATAEDTPLVFSAAGGNALGVSDSDAGAFPVRLSVTATQGTLTLGSIAGLSFTEGDGTADVAMTFTGSLTDVNAALEGMAYQPDANFTSPPEAFLVVTSNDQGATGSGGPLSDSDTVAINVVPVNDVPLAAADSFSYRANDGNALSETATATIQVTSVPDVETRHAGYCWASAGSSETGIPWVAVAAALVLFAASLRRRNRPDRSGADATETPSWTGRRSKPTRTRARSPSARTSSPIRRPASVS